MRLAAVLVLLLDRIHLQGECVEMQVGPDLDRRPDAVGGCRGRGGPCGVDVEADGGAQCIDEVVTRHAT